MTPRAVSLVVTRLLALWCGVSAASTLASAPALDWGGPGEFRHVQALSVASLVVVPLVCGVVLWLGSGWLARQVAGEMGSTALAALDSEQLFTLGVSFLGIVVVVQVLPELAQAGAFAVAARYMPKAEESVDSSLQLQRWVYQQAGFARLVSLAARLVIGVVLMVGPKYAWCLVRRFVQKTFGSQLRKGPEE